MKVEKIRNIIIAAVIVCICLLLGYIALFATDGTEVNTQEKKVQITRHTYSENKDEAHRFLIVENEGKFGFADLNGKLVTELKYDMASVADYGLYYVKEGVKSGFLNSELETVFMSDETIATTVSEDFVIYTRNGKSGFINIKTAEKIEAEYEAVYDFSEGLAGVQKDGKLGFIDPAGETVIKHKYYPKGLNYFKQGKCYVRDDEKTPLGYYIDKNGNRAIETGFLYGMPFYEGRAFIKQEDGWHIADDTGALVTTEALGPYDKALPGRYSEGRATVIANGKYGVMDAQGNYVIYPDFEELSRVENGRVVFKSGGKYGYMMADGTVIIPASYDYLSSFKNNVAVFEIEDKKGIVNLNGKQVLSELYQTAEILDNGVMKVSSDGENYRFFDVNGKEIEINIEKDE